MLPYPSRVNRWQPLALPQGAGSTESAQSRSVPSVGRQRRRRRREVEVEVERARRCLHPTPEVPSHGCRITKRLSLPTAPSAEPHDFRSARLLATPPSCGLSPRCSTRSLSAVSVPPASSCVGCKANPATTVARDQNRGGGGGGGGDPPRHSSAPPPSPPALLSYLLVSKEAQAPLWVYMNIYIHTRFWTT